MPLLPKPPDPIVSLDFFGMKNAALKLFFWSLFAFCVWEFCRWKTGPVSARAVIEVTVMSFVVAMHTAVGFHKMILGIVNNARDAAHQQEITRLQASQPVYRYEMDEAGKFQPKQRPLYDEQMGVER